MLKHPLDLGIERAVWTLHDIKQKISVFTHVVHQHVNDPTNRSVFPIPVVEPVANGGVGLPRVRVDFGHDTPFKVLDPTAL